MTNEEYLKVFWTATEMQDVRELGEINESFRTNVLERKLDFTFIIKEELLNILYGPIPRNFIINIKNNIGSPTGVFKSSFGLQLAGELDPTFNVKERVAFTPNQLNDLVKKNATRKQVFVLDERIHDLKQSADMRLANIAESCRERQICIIMIGVSEKFLNISHYHFERFGESSDKFLPKKTVYYLIKKITENRKVYRGYIKHNITPLTDPNWKKIWDDYMELKSAHQDAVIDQKVSAFDFKMKAKEFASMAEFMEECVTEGGLPIRAKVKNFIYQHMPDVTNDERKMVITELNYSLDKYLEEISKIKQKDNDRDEDESRQETEEE